MDYLREGIGLRAMAQRDPLVEYQREGFDMFNSMMEGIKEESVAYLFNSQVEVQQNPIVEEPAGEVPAVPYALGQVTGTVPGGGTVSGGGTVETGPVGAVPADANGAPDDDGAGRGAGERASGRGGRRRGAGRHAASGRSGGGAHAATRPPAGQPAVAAPGLSRPQQPARLSYSAPTVDGEAGVERRSEPAGGGDFGKVGRNAPCPCGSGRKYKLCHGDPRNRPAS